MSDVTARTKLINFQERRLEAQDQAIEDLKAEVKRLEEAKAKGEPIATRYSKTWERLAVLAVSGVIAIGQSCVSTYNRNARADDDVKATMVLAERDVARGRADSLYDVASDILIESAEQGCEVEVK